MRLFKIIFPEKLKLYGWLAIASLIAMNILTYYGSKFFTSSAYHYDFTTSIDRMIPFIPAAILIYSVIGYTQWGIGYYWAACEDKKTVIYIFGAEILAKIPSMIIFLLVPTTMVRAEITGTDIFSLFVKMVYFMDEPNTLFPSFHVLESYILLRTLPLLKKAPRWYKKMTPIVSPLVIFSILFVKQHLVVDILGAIAVSEFGLLTMKIAFKLWAKRRNISAKSGNTKLRANVKIKPNSLSCETE